MIYNFYSKLIILILLSFSFNVFSKDLTVVIKDRQNKKVATVTYINRGNKVDFEINWEPNIDVSQNVLKKIIKSKFYSLIHYLLVIS